MREYWKRHNFVSEGTAKSCKRTIVSLKEIAMVYQRKPVDWQSLASRLMIIFSFRSLGIMLCLYTSVCSDYVDAMAQQANQWSRPQTIPDFHPDTEPPVMVVDQNRVVHAFASQLFSEQQGEWEVAITYNQWTLEQGWTKPVDILLSPLRNDARVMAAHLDGDGVMHVFFFGGNELEANIYYTHAWAVDAGNAQAWASPTLVGEQALVPRSAAFNVDAQGNFVLLYGSNSDGNGLYATYSADEGVTWSEPAPIFLTYNENRPFALQIHAGKSGQLHAIWNVMSRGGQGRGIYYSRAEDGQAKWSEPVKLAEAESGLGTMTPTMIEHDGVVFAIYNMPPKIVMRRSMDGGDTWTEPVILFSRHVGVNGAPSLVVDGNDDLHMFFGQRVPGSPDIHGMWHTMLRGNTWPEPEAVVSGPSIVDEVGDTSFDPVDARAIVSQGNVLLVTWRTDPGLTGNGVWYSYKIVNAPELPVVSLPTSRAAPIAAILPTVVRDGPPSTPSPSAVGPNSIFTTLEDTPARPNRTTAYPAIPLLAGIIPVALLIVSLVVTRQMNRDRRH
jgi:hypothetical protein